MKPLAVALAALCTLPANASVLTFSIDGLGNHGIISQDYGDRIQQADDGTFHYLLDDGPTPNIVVDYFPSNPAHWNTGYGDLAHILFDDSDGRGHIEVTLTADPGYLVSLHSFDLAAYDSVFNQDPTIDLVSVTADCEQVLYLEDTLVSEKARTVYDFADSPPTGRQVTILVRCGNLGSLSDDIGIDNIRFAQSPDNLPDCYPDFTADGSLDLFDFLAFVNAFNAAQPLADCDLSCGFDLFDFLCFTNAFNQGC